MLLDRGSFILVKKLLEHSTWPPQVSEPVPDLHTVPSRRLHCLLAVAERNLAVGGAELRHALLYCGFSGHAM
jgi:hypothetical protein